ncbi:hypothetical protein PIB30_069310 [Stylosanthes scabra]|uniref:Uncharacterized protein n=1 Tax=Stylosanthes scabra TaxID=79078 RepID=A0ABU6VMS6_9FABA|nr:hypothetical protein [Stylosanthes scabra]
MPPPRYPRRLLHHSSPALFFTAPSPPLTAPPSRSPFTLFLLSSTPGALLHCVVAAFHCTTFAISSLSSFLASPHRVTAASSASMFDSGEALMAEHNADPCVGVLQQSRLFIFSVVMARLGLGGGGGGGKEPVLVWASPYKAQMSLPLKTARAKIHHVTTSHASIV